MSDNRHIYDAARRHIAAQSIIVLEPPRRRHRWLLSGVAFGTLVMANAWFASQAAICAPPPDLMLGAAGAWTFYNSARKYIGSADIDLNQTSNFRMSLYTSASNAATSAAVITVRGSVTSEVTEQFGYSSSGKALTGVTWTTGASAAQIRWNSSAVFWSANGGTIGSIKFAVIWYTTGEKLLVRSQLSTAQFSITAGNRLTITPSANGIFTLSGG